MEIERRLRGGREKEKSIIRRQATGRTASDASYDHPFSIGRIPEELAFFAKKGPGFCCQH